MALTENELYDLIGNRRYCFVVMRYNDNRSIYNNLKGWIEEIPNMICVRADDVPASGAYIPEKVHQLIDNAEIVIADLSDPSANVYYELGYAKAKGKKILIVCQTGTQLEVDVQGIERLEYSDTKESLFYFRHEVENHIIAALESERRLLRNLLLGKRSLPAYILASPRQFTARKSDENTRERRTYGDYLGVVGIVSAFGSLLGQDGVPELLDASHAQKDILKQDANIYIIGSPRANCFCEEALSMIQARLDNQFWKFRIDAKSENSSLCGLLHGEPFEHHADYTNSVPKYDYGIFIRAPHPNFEGRQIVILAGTRSLGTGAACLAATRPRLIKQIVEKLPKGLAEDRDKPIWALIRAVPDPNDNHASVEHTTVADAGTFV